jgi:hypothetical protein
MLTDKDRKRILVLVFLIGLIVLGDIVSGAIGIASGPSLASDTCTVSNMLCPHDTYPLGTWFNFPDINPPCNPQPTGFAGACELLGNSSYRGLLVTHSSFGENGLNVALVEECITPSNTVGSQLQLQYANYSETTRSNSSNFVNIGGSDFIDNINDPCPGVVTSGTGVLPPISLNPSDFLFRVIGYGGGGTGDNPRFSMVAVLISQAIGRIYQIQAAGITTAHFLWKPWSSYPLTTATTVTISWIGTNQTTTACGTNDNCIQSGTSSCSIPAGTIACSSFTTVTFGTAFTGTVIVTTTPQTTGALVSIPVGSISLLSAQTLTV